MEKEPKLAAKLNSGLLGQAKQLVAWPGRATLIDLIVLASYYLFCLFLVLGLMGSFKKEFIILGLVPVFIFFLFFRNQVSTGLLKPGFNRLVVFFVLVPALFAGILLVKGVFNGDGIGYWLPWAREIVLQARMPDFLFNTTSWVTSRMPLMPLFYAGIFAFLGFHDWAAAILPFFFSAATVFLLYRWLLEKGASKSYIIFGVLLLLANPMFLHLGGEAAQEPFILFFFTAFFYYLEKSQRENRQFHLLLAALSAVLAAVSKETGLILFLPLAWFLIKNQQLIKRTYLYLFLIFPLFIWLIRNYIIYGNPLFPSLIGIFRGQYYNLALTASRFFQGSSPAFWDNISARLAEIPASLFLLVFPAAILSFYGFWKERKFQYILLFIIFLFGIFSITASAEYVRFLMPFAAIFIVYAVAGLEKISSRIFLSFIFSLNLLGLFYTKLSSSQSQFFSPVERALSGFGSISQFIYDYRVFFALTTGVFFYFLISRYQEKAKYLILLIISVYLVKTPSFNLGSWLNIWLPILGIIFIILIWRLMTRKIAFAYVIILLLLNSWGLSAAYFLAHKNFVFPNFAEAYGAQPDAADAIEKLEGENKDFYVYSVTSAYFNWYRNFKTVASRDYTFHVITNLEWSDGLGPSEIHNLFKRSNIKYVMENIYRPQFQPFFDKIKSQPDLFKIIFQKEGVFLWQVI